MFRRQYWEPCTLYFGRGSILPKAIVWEYIGGDGRSGGLGPTRHSSQGNLLGIVAA